ncbi:MAG: ornithine cyclodeaminase family protein [Notoacmeibacter sp.]|nr:ornithine cyclodeaminase family protein [Notoacmeibacter sp.]MCC0032397.1 ornithine cyclodeaminase family protein [Brucellaceae bacterium]
MRFIDAATVDRLLPYETLVDVLAAAFRDGMVQPVRHHHTVERAKGAASTLLLMPAWTDFTKGSASSKGHIGIKIVTVSPDNNACGLPAVMGQYLLLDGETGAPQAIIDGQRLTARRTAAASALAARYLARADATRHLICGAGALAGELAAAHASVRPLRSVTIWNRSPDKAAALAASLRDKGMDARATEDLTGAQGEADIISCCTLSDVPLVRGHLVAPGTHVDLVGAFTPAMRESDDALMARGNVYADTLGGALKEGGDIVLAMQSGALTRDQVMGDLHGLTRGEIAGRTSSDEITVFKSVGAALEDLAAAIAVYEALDDQPIT